MKHIDSKRDGGSEDAPPGRSVPRRLHSQVLTWHDEVSGDRLTIDVQGSEQFLAGLAPLGFLPAGELTHSSNNAPPIRGVSGLSERKQAPAVKGAAPRKSAPRELPLPPSGRSALERPKGPDGMTGSDSAENRVRWTARLARHWNPQNR
jgi:hypothetical protein